MIYDREKDQPAGPVGWVVHYLLVALMAAWAVGMVLAFTSLLFGWPDPSVGD